jgi:hypothetical protein
MRAWCGSGRGGMVPGSGSRYSFVAMVVAVPRAATQP